MPWLPEGAHKAICTDTDYYIMYQKIDPKIDPPGEQTA